MTKPLERTPLNVVLARSRWALIAARSWLLADGHATLQIVIVWRRGLERKTKRGRIGLPWLPLFVDSDAEMLKLGVRAAGGRFLTVPDDIRPLHRKVSWRQSASILAVPLPSPSLEGLTFACQWRLAGIPLTTVELGPLANRPIRSSGLKRDPHELEPGALVPLNWRVAGNDRAEVWLPSLVAETGGFALGVMRHVKDGDLDLKALPVQYVQGGPTDDVFRFGIEYSSGARATSLDEQCGVRRRSAQLRVVSRDYPEKSAVEVAWCTPVPAGGSVTFVCEWPSAGIALTRRRLDGVAIREAAALSARLARS